MTLIERLESAPEGSRELDGEIALLLGWKKTIDGFYNSRWKDPAGQLQGNIPPAFTTSIDAALTLVPEGWRWDIGPWDDQIRAEIWNHTEDETKEQYCGFASTPALALCIAALKARSDG